jgi:hypothetical protein
MATVEFVSYDGGFPNLCRGLLSVKVDGVLWDFENGSLSSGGGVSFDKDWQEEVRHGEWSIYEWPKGFPEDEDVRRKVLELVNDFIPRGCCGGCV